jgi:C-terminal processing protease CtpA/Prc
MDNFEHLWTACDQKYSYFKLKEVDWDNVRTQYASLIYEGMSSDSLFNVLGAMLSELKDDHVNLFSQTNTSFFGVEYAYQDNFDWQILVDHYLSNDFKITGPFSHDFIADKQIGYVRLSSFSTDITNTHLDYIMTRYGETKGLILDLRENGGGKIPNVFKILSRFVTTKTLVSYSRIKSGPVHDDFGAPEPVYVDPYGGKGYTGKVVVLTDRGTYSSGSLFALNVKAIENMILIGDTTGGGLGMPNGGQLPNGWTYRFSVTQSLTLDRDPSYENGVPSDIYASFDWNDLTTDEILEQAIQEIF